MIQFDHVFMHTVSSSNKSQISLAIFLPVLSRIQITGADPGFSFTGGGGGRKRLCASTHITSVEPNSLSAGVQALEALGLLFSAI